MVKGGSAGLLVPPKRLDLLAEAALRLLCELANLSEMRARSQFNIEKLSNSRVTEETIRIYHEIL